MGALNKLTDAQARNAKPNKDTGKASKISDGGGLTLLVKEVGKYWQLRYRFLGKEQTLSLGVYPQVSLAQAREARDKAKTQLKEGINPSAQKRSAQMLESVEDTFEYVALEWLELNKSNLAGSTYQKSLWLLELLFPSIGGKPIRTLTPKDMLDAVRLIEARGTHESAHRAKQKAGQVFRYAIACDRADNDPTTALRGALAPVQQTPRAAITEPKKIGELLRAIDGYSGHFTTAFALRLGSLVFVRPGELRMMEWVELDYENHLWRIPAQKMKMRQEHIVPLSRQAREILERIRPLTGTGRYVFPGIRTAERPMSENTLNAALRRLGYQKTEMTAHGFRAMASTRLNEMGDFSSDIIERQLAHVERHTVRGRYNRAIHLDKRIELMQYWADYLDKLKSPDNDRKLIIGNVDDIADARESRIKNIGAASP